MNNNTSHEAIELRDRAATLELRQNDLLRFIDIMDGISVEDRQVSWQNISKNLREILNGEQTQD